MSLNLIKSGLNHSTTTKPEYINFIVDSHCHLDLLAEKGLVIEEIIKSAESANVKLLQTICTKISDFSKIYQYAKQYPNVFASIGIHPNNVDQEPQIKSSQIIELCQQNSKIIGIGETGLDYYRSNNPSKENQITSFLEHIEASVATGLPLIIHSRNADEDMIKILAAAIKKNQFKALLHCFSSSREMAFKALDLGIYISISGIVTFSNAKDLQAILLELPLNRILVETDSPYLAPTPNRGKINQPAYTKEIVESIAKLKKLPIEEVISATSQNFFKLFSRCLQ